MKSRFAVAIVAVGAVMASWCGSAAATTNPQADISLRCENGRAIASFSYAGFSRFWHLTARQNLSAGAVGVGNTYQFDGPAGAQTIALRLPAGNVPVTISASTVVTAAGGRVKASASRTVRCVPPPPVVARPSARFWGPCGDPFYRAVLNNLHSGRAVSFAVNWKPFGHDRRTLWVRVPAHRLRWTGLFDVAGSTRMTIKAGGRILASRVSAPNAVYGSCPTGVPVL